MTEKTTEKVTEKTTEKVASRWALGALLLFVAGRCLVPMDETDLFFNLRLGELVLTGHTVPRTNLLSFTFPDFRDVNLAWLFQILLALAYRAGGIAGTVVLKTGFVLATFALLFRVALRRGAHPAATAATLALCAWAAEPRFVERPHLCTFLGLAFLLLALERTEDGRPRALWALVPLGLLWANANSCFFLAPAVLLLYAAGARLEGRGGDARRAALIALCLLPLVLATPSGTGALSYIANHWRMPWVRPLQEYRVAEWPLDGPFLLASGGVAIAAALPGRRLRHVIPALALAALGSRRIRFAAEAALLAGPILALLLTQLLNHIGARLGPPRRAWPVTGAVAAALVCLTLIPRLTAARRGERLIDLGLERDLIPLEAIRFVDDHGLGLRMYNDLEVGSYLTWHAWPRRVFQDPRINGYPEAFHAVLRRADLTRDAWEELLSGFGVTTALITYPDLNPRAALFDPARWALVYRAADGLAFAARRPEFAALIARTEIPQTFVYSPHGEEGVSAQPLVTRPAASSVPDCEWQRRVGDVLIETGGDPRAAAAAYRSARARPGCLDEQAHRAASLALGDTALRLQDPATAVEAYAGIDLPRAHRNRGLALLALGRAQEALAELRAALASDPDDADARRAEAIARSRLDRRGK